jgi:hypothetical protein
LLHFVSFGFIWLHFASFCFIILSLFFQETMGELAERKQREEFEKDKKQVDAGIDYVVRPQPGSWGFRAFF